MTRIVLPLTLSLLMLASSTGRPTCPVTKNSSVIATGYSECVIRASSSTVGDYVLLCSYPTQGGAHPPSAVLALRFLPNHTPLQAVQINQNVAYQNLALDLADVGGTGQTRWVPGWSGRTGVTDPISVWHRRMNGVFQPLGSEIKILDPIGADRIEVIHSIAILPQTRRIVTAATLASQYGANSCNGLLHEERRAVFNLRDSNFNTLINKQLVSSFCSYDPAHQDEGQQNVDIAASWLLSDFFVVTWLERGLGNTDKVYARVYDVVGTPVSSDILVDDLGVSGLGVSPRVAAVPSGFMIVWARPDNHLWLRTYNVQGSPLISKRRVTSSELTPGGNPEIDSALVDTCGSGDEPYFAISWWANTSGNVWRPQMTMFRGIANPVSLSGASGYFAFTSPNQVGQDSPTDRVSISFFNKTNISDSACDDLTLGTSWTVTTPTNANELRTQFIRWVPTCGQSFSANEQSSEALPEGFASYSDSASANENLNDCVEPDCVLFDAGARDENEPAITYPPEY